MARKNEKPAATEADAARDAANETPASSTRTARFSPAKVGFLRPAVGVVALWFVLAAAQGAANRIATVGWDARTVGMVAVVSLFTMMVGYLVTRWPQDSYRYLASTYASVVWIMALALGTALGTVVLQGSDSATFMARYPNAASALRAACLDDVFHSWPFRAVGLGLLISSLATVIQRRKTIYKWRHLGLLTTHISLLVIVVGGMWGSSQGAKGMLHLRVGGPASDTMLLNGGEHQNEPMRLPFAVKLEKFELSHHTPEYRLYTWERTADGRSTLVASDAPKVGAPAGVPVPGTGVTTRITRVFTRARPVEEAVAGDLTPPHMIVAPGGEQVPVTPGSEVTLKDGTRVAVDAFYPDFFYDMQNRRGASRSDQPNNPTLSVRVQGADGVWTAPRFLFGREDMRGMMTGAHDAAAGLTYRFNRAAGRMVRWVEGTEGPENPAVEVEVTDQGKVRLEMRFGTDPQALFLAPGRAVFFEEKSDSIRNYRSTLTVLQGNAVIAQKLIEVNDPLYIGDYGLFQSNFDRNDPSYSGIQVVHDPGLNFSLAGLWLLVAGILQALTLRNWEPWWERKKTTDRAGGAVTTEAEVHA